jgi:hypothetical protein
VAAGTRTPMIIWRHILPNTLAPMTVQATYICASAMITEAILSFIGAGTPPIIPSWGNIMAEGRALWQVKPYIVFFPAMFLSITVLAVNLLGDGLRDALDPRMAKLGFAGGDRKMLRDLLAKDVFEGFEAAIRDRESRGEQVETRFVGIEKAEIVDAQMRGDQAQVTMKFVSQLVTATRDRAGAVIDGSPERVTDVTDVWTFARNVTDRDPNWRLIATEAGG